MGTENTKETEVKFLRPDEVCRLLKCSRVTLWRLRKKGKIKAYGIGSMVRYREDEVISSMVELKVA